MHSGGAALKAKQVCNADEGVMAIEYPSEIRIISILAFAKGRKGAHWSRCFEDGFGEDG